MNTVFDNRAQSVTHNLLRIAAGLFFWQHGAQKLFGWLGGNQVESLASWMGVAGILEFFGGLLIAMGLLTRPVAFILAGEMAVAYFWRHAPQSVWPIMNRGEVAALFCFIFLYFAAHGAGSFSLDRLLSRRSPPPRSE